MMCVGEHVHRAYSSDFIVLAEYFEVTSLRCRVATYIDHTVWCGIEDYLSNIRVNSCARWVKYDDVRASMFCNKCICKYILHVTCKEVAVGDTIVASIELCIFNSFRNIFNTNNFRRLARYKLSDSTCACIEVIYYFIACK